MISLERAEKLNIIKSKNKIVQNLKDQNYIYNSKFISNYPNTFYQ